MIETDMGLQAIVDGPEAMMAWLEAQGVDWRAALGLDAHDLVSTGRLTVLVARQLREDLTMAAPARDNAPHTSQLTGSGSHSSSVHADVAQRPVRPFYAGTVGGSNPPVGNSSGSAPADGWEAPSAGIGHQAEQPPSVSLYGEIRAELMDARDKAASIAQRHQVCAHVEEALSLLDKMVSAATAAEIDDRPTDAQLAQDLGCPSLLVDACGEPDPSRVYVAHLRCNLTVRFAWAQPQSDGWLTLHDIRPCSVPEALNTIDLRLDDVVWVGVEHLDA